jgi:hypothetical protein
VRSDTPSAIRNDAAQWRRSWSLMSDSSARRSVALNSCWTVRGSTRRPKGVVKTSSNRIAPVGARRKSFLRLARTLATQERDQSDRDYQCASAALGLQVRSATRKSDAPAILARTR